MNVNIGEKRTFDDWGLKLKQIAISMPETKTNTIDIPGADGTLDLTEVLGPVRFHNREMQLIFDCSGTLDAWHTLTSQIAAYLHGRRLKVILETDPNYYYIGRLSLDSVRSDQLMNQITITGDMEPYKYELLSGMEPWLWDPFNFETGIIRNYNEILVDGSLEVKIPGTVKVTVPTIYASAEMTVEYLGKTYELNQGANKIYEIALGPGEHILTFHGYGTVSIDYRGGIL